jgi:nucleoid-associated protein YgaU
MPRYANSEILDNDLEFYEFLRKKRQVKTSITHYNTPVFKNLSAAERSRIKTTKHIWTYGDRFYKLAHQFYSDVNYWWVIALFNGYPTEATVKPGDMILIPLDLENTLMAMGMY